ncbi:universal stress protein [Thermophagus sp. OGC60D27]|uniref:universal stress protein n=1 Tax=Thermophagus sp. OGC60D27 TaxID=3458415 RepID=UPI004037C025
MESLMHSILVPYDFSDTVIYAVQHAVNLSRVLNTKITLLHIVKRQSEIKASENKLRQDADKIEQKLHIKLEILVKEGTIFKTINEVSEELECAMVVMITHGMRGMQKLTGSWALKVIVGSRVPFLVVQEPPQKNDYTKIVFPVDFKSENKEKLRWAEYMSLYFKTKIYLFSSVSKEGVLDGRTKANVVFCKNFLEEKKIDYELVLAKHKASFSQETIDFAKENQADLIIIMTTRDIAFHDYFLGVQEQDIIANSAKVPVMVINPRTDLMKYGYGGSF